VGASAAALFFRPAWRLIDHTVLHILDLVALRLAGSALAGAGRLRLGHASPAQQTLDALAHDESRDAASDQHDRQQQDSNRADGHQKSATPSAALPAATRPKAQLGMVTVFWRDFPRYDRRSIRLGQRPAKHHAGGLYVALASGESKACGCMHLPAVAHALHS
jgi:hypothetical protein